MENLKRSEIKSLMSAIVARLVFINDELKRYDVLISNEADKEFLSKAQDYRDYLTRDSQKYCDLYDKLSHMKGCDE